MTDKLKELRRLVEAATPTTIVGYIACREGHIWSTTRWRGRQVRRLTEHLNRSGYACVRLTVNGRRRCCRVHRLVCEAFHGAQPSSRHEVRHLNGVRTDNRPENLAWGTRSENAADRKAHGTETAVENGRATRFKDGAVNQNSGKTHCLNGHPFSGENLRTNKGGGRVCRRCHRDRQNRYNALRKLEGQADG